jgi:hypothetical protein
MEKLIKFFNGKAQLCCGLGDFIEIVLLIGVISDCYDEVPDFAHSWWNDF